MCVFVSQSFVTHHPSRTTSFPTNMLQYRLHKYLGTQSRKPVGDTAADRGSKSIWFRISLISHQSRFCITLPCFVSNCIIKLIGKLVTDRLYEPHPHSPHLPCFLQSAAGHHNSLKDPKLLSFHICSFYSKADTKQEERRGQSPINCIPHSQHYHQKTTRNTTDRPQSQAIRKRSWPLPLSNSRQQPQQPTQRKLRLPEKVRAVQ